MQKPLSTDPLTQFGGEATRSIRCDKANTGDILEDADCMMSGYTTPKKNHRTPKPPGVRFSKKKRRALFENRRAFFFGLRPKKKDKENVSPSQFSGRKKNALKTTTPSFIFRKKVLCFLSPVSGLVSPVLICSFRRFSNLFVPGGFQIVFKSTRTRWFSFVPGGFSNLSLYPVV